MLVAAAAILAEALLHDYLSGRADRFYPKDNGRKKYCYVNCMSTRIHGFNPTWPNIASLTQEAGNLVVGRNDLAFHAQDSVGDLAANVFGQASAAVLWRWCKDLCEECPF